MRGSVKKQLKQRTAAFLAAVTAVCQLQTAPALAALAGTPVAAADETGETVWEEEHYEPDYRTVALGATGLATPSEATSSDADWAGDYLYYGSYVQEAEEAPAPIRWRILSPESGEQGGEESKDHVLLFSDQVLERRTFAAEYSPDQNWKDSQLREWLNAEEGFYGTAFSKEEQEAVAASRGVLASPSDAAASPSEARRMDEASAEGTLPPDEEIGGSRVFLLSAGEAREPSFGFYGKADAEEPENQTDNSRILTATEAARRQAEDLTEDGRTPWWLRSRERGGYGFNAGTVDVYGMTDSYEASSLDMIGVAPAWQMDKGKLLFTSPARSEKPEIATGSNCLKEVERRDKDDNGRPQPGSEWKATIADERHEAFQVHLDGTRLPDGVIPGSGVQVKESPMIYRAAPEEEVVFSYSGAVAGTEEEPEVISVILTDPAGTVLYYGSVKEICAGDEPSGRAAVRLPGLTEGGRYGFYVFEERRRGECRTDYASSLKAAVLEVKIGRPVEVDGGTVYSVASSSNADPVLTDSPEASAYEGWRVRVKAAPAPEDMGFDRWQTTPVSLKWTTGEGRDADGVFVMPDWPVTLKAVYRNLASPSDATAVQDVEPDGWLAYGDWDDVNAMLEDEEIITPAEREKLEKGWNVTLHLKLEKTGRSISGEPEFAKEVKESIAEGERVGFFFQTSLSKKIYSRTGKLTDTVSLASSSNAVRITAALPEDCLRMEDYRIVGHGAQDSSASEWVLELIEDEEGAAEGFTFTAEANGTYALVYRELFDNPLEIAIPDVTYGEQYEPEVIKNLSDAEVRFEYKEQGAPDGMYTEEAPADAGEYTVRATAEAEGKYRKAVVEKNFMIHRKPLDAAMQKPVADQTYTGGDIFPEIVLSDISPDTGEEMITEGDYVVAFRDNRYIGDASFTVTASEEGNYQGAFDGTFRIIKRRSGGSSSGDGGSRPSEVTGTWYRMADGTWRFIPAGQSSYAAGTWLKTGGKWYYFYPDGTMATGWLLIGQEWYYLEEMEGSGQGAMATGWLTDRQDGNTYYLDPATGAMAVGWKKIDGVWYYFTDTAETVPGWILDTEGNGWIYTKKKSRPRGSLWKGETPEGTK